MMPTNAQSLRRFSRLSRHFTSNVLLVVKREMAKEVYSEILCGWQFQAIQIVLGSLPLLGALIYFLFEVSVYLFGAHSRRRPHGHACKSRQRSKNFRSELKLEISQLKQDKEELERANAVLSGKIEILMSENQQLGLNHQIAFFTGRSGCNHITNCFPRICHE
jgi:hypothetical protein